MFRRSAARSNGPLATIPRLTKRKNNARCMRVIRDVRDRFLRGEWNSMHRVIWLITAWVLLTCQATRAQDWVSQVFPERSHDFGTVARGSRVHHTFRVVNTTPQEIQIADWRTKCG